MTRLKYIILLSFSIMLGGLNACVSTSNQRANLKQIYDQSAQYHEPDRNPIIVIPGILGSKLVDDTTGQTVWGAFRKNYADPNTADGAKLVSLSLDPQNDMPAGLVRADGVLENLELNLAGFPITIQAYAEIGKSLALPKEQVRTVSKPSKKV